jgi:membrane-bound metal-dependent hydrolase YbcI (DUF457 family)
MLPAEHLAVAAIPVVAYVLLRDRRPPAPRLLGIVFVGSQFPELIDKPLAHQFHILPSGRVFVHSLPIAIPIVCVVGWYAWQTHRLRAGAAFSFAYLSHIVADNWEALSPPEPMLPSDLLWPLQPPIPRPVVPGWAGANGINVRLWTLFSVVVLCITVYYVFQDVAEHIQGGALSGR